MRVEKPIYAIAGNPRVGTTGATQGEMAALSKLADLFFGHETKGMMPRGSECKPDQGAEIRLTALGMEPGYLDSMLPRNQ